MGLDPATHLGDGLRGRRRGVRPLAQRRHPGGAHRPLRRERELLVHDQGGAGPCGPNTEINYDFGADAGLRPARLLAATAHAAGLRPLHRDLEPRVHDAVPGRGRHRAARCRSATSTPAPASSAGRARLHVAEQRRLAGRPEGVDAAADDLRRRPLPADPRARRRAGGHRLRRRRPRSSSGRCASSPSTRAPPRS